MTGYCKVTEEEAREHPEYMCDAGEMKWDLDIDAILAHNKRRGGCCGSARGKGPLTCGKPMPDHANPNIPHHHHDKKTCCGYNE